jgi:hypothetical protein
VERTVGVGGEQHGSLDWSRAPGVWPGSSQLLVGAKVWSELLREPADFSTVELIVWSGETTASAGNQGDWGRLAGGIDLAAEPGQIQNIFDCRLVCF